ncbi:GNAT family protein [Psychrobacillus sp. FSL K6-2836]|uniref:GNAT family N-acetyltransferase n=1 Tax=Psychrobacillus sp. FSL K6-2836 TaxID=2921548 RepID=UPI0030F56F64
MAVLSEILTYGDVTLRPILVSDYELLWKLYEPEIFEYMLNKIESKEQLEQWLNAGIYQMNVAKTALAFVVVNTDTKEIMGTTRIYGVDQTNYSCEIGSTFYGKQYQRTHVNTTCKYLLLKYCFEQIGMIRVQFKTDELNLSSQRAIERIGGKKEGILRNERIRSNGSARNAVVYSIIESEWSEVKYKLVQLMNKYS